MPLLTFADGTVARAQLITAYDTWIARASATLPMVSATIAGADAPAANSYWASMDVGVEYCEKLRFKDSETDRAYP